MALYLPGFASAIKVYLERLDFGTVKWLTSEFSKCVKHFHNRQRNDPLPWVNSQHIMEVLELLSKVVATVILDKKERLSQFETTK